MRNCDEEGDDTFSSLTMMDDGRHDSATLLSNIRNERGSTTTIIVHRDYLTG